MKKLKIKDEERESLAKRAKMQKEHKKMVNPTPKLATPTIRMFSNDHVQKKP